MQKAYFEHLEARGIPAWVWIINCEKHFDEALDYGIKGIFTDYPTKLKQYLDNTKKVDSTNNWWYKYLQYYINTVLRVF